MCGDYDGVIGMDARKSVARLKGAVPRPRLEPAAGPGGVYGVFIETNAKGHVHKD